MKEEDIKYYLDFFKDERVAYRFGNGREFSFYKVFEQLYQLETNWKELKNFIEEEIEHNVDGVKSFSGYQCKIILDKMQEIESRDNGE